MASNGTPTASFSSRWGMLLAMLGMAVGTGNIWRFPRIAASNGGGAFLVAWVTFLLLWSVPLIMVEFAMGKGTRAGPVGAFVRLLGPKFAWMGAWVAFTATAIMFYYAVVMGWTIRYFWASLTGELSGAAPGALWDSFAYTPSVLVVHALALALAAGVVWRGVKGIESAAKILIPTLFVLVVVLAVKALTLPGASRGLDFLFGFEWSELADANIWLQALTQNAWDTGAGWGLVLTYAIYMKAREDTVLNSALLAFGNNSVSLLAGIMVLCTVFSIMPDAATEIVGASNEGLTFIWVPQLFQQMPGGRFFMTLFFLALMFAAWTSLIAMIELATRTLVDTGVRRGRALTLVVVFGFALGVPSALNEEFFLNQDFVWGVGLMVSGLFFAYAVIRHGARRFRETLVNTADSDVHVGVWWERAMYFVIVQALVLIGWWFWQVRGEPQISPFGAGLMALEWAAAIAVFLAANKWLARAGGARPPVGDPPPASIP
ncbi:MAG: sodium-dependent transporter [Gemmatimonadota bacterium]